MERKSFLQKFNLVLFVVMVLLIFYGTMTILSTVILKETNPLDNKLFLNHLFNFTIGMILYIVLSQVDYRLFQHVYWLIFLVTVSFLVLTPVIGIASHGSARWFEIAGFSFQPSEFAKISTILFLAAFLVRFGNVKRRILYFSSSILLAGGIAGLVFIQPDLGTSLVIVVVWFVMYYLSGMKLLEFVFLVFSAAFLIPFSWQFLHDYQKSRIAIFLNPAQDPLGQGYSVLQSIIAVGSGRFWGLGWGRGTQSKLQFLPERHTDFIFATLSEEMGFIGVFLLVMLFVILFLALLHILKSTNDPYGKLIVGGIFGWFIFQILVNIGMNMGIMPITGIPLIFISYGGSSLIASMMSLGIVQSIVKYGKS